MSKFGIRCIFHEEKTPSFMIDFKVNKYHCFSCGKEGELHCILEDYRKHLTNEDLSDEDINLQTESMIKRITSDIFNKIKEK